MMPPTLHATLHFAHQDVEELLKEHVESQGYFVVSVTGDDDQGWDVKARPMTREERAVHDLPIESVEDRLQAKIDALVEDTTQAFGSMQKALERQAGDTQHALELRLAELRELNESMQVAMLEIHTLAEEHAAAPIFAPVTLGDETPAYPIPAAPAAPPPSARISPAVEPVAPAAPMVSKRVESLSFADAAAQLRETESSTDLANSELRRANYNKLRAELEAEAAENAFTEDIEGASTEFPSEEAIR